jgi:hypothetical protein
LALNEVDFDDDVEYEDDSDYCPDESTDNDSEEYDSADNSEVIDEEYCADSTSLNDSTFDALENQYIEILSEDESLLCVRQLLTKARSLQKLTRNTSCILRFMRKKKIEHKLKVEFIKDFQIRWNYTYKFLVHMVKYKSILLEVTSKFRMKLMFYSVKIFILFLFKQNRKISKA